MFYINFYDRMKEKTQKGFDNMIHFQNLLNFVISRFEWKNLPDNIPQSAMEGILLSNGTCGFTKIGSEYWAIPGTYCGEYKGYLPTEYTGTLPGLGKGVATVNGKVGEKWAVGWNNATMTPDLILYQYASILSEIDISERCNVRNTRFLRIPKVRNEREKAVVLQAMKNISIGKLDAIVGETGTVDARELLGVQQADDEKFLDLVDVDKVDKLQYLNQYRDNVIKRFGQIYGQKTQVSNKLAQMTDDEIHSNDSFSNVLTEEALFYRKKFCDDINALFGLNISVDLSKCFKDEFEEMEALDDGGTGDETEELQDFGTDDGSRPGGPSEDDTD